MSIALKIEPPDHGPLTDDDLDRLLGNRMLRAPQTFGGPSVPTLYRAWRHGLIEVVKNGNRTMLTRATMKKILTEGLGPIPWKTT
jgi:hypothetical protein